MNKLKVCLLSLSCVLCMVMFSGCKGNVVDNVNDAASGVVSGTESIVGNAGSAVESVYDEGKSAIVDDDENVESGILESDFEDDIESSYIESGIESGDRASVSE